MVYILLADENAFHEATWAILEAACTPPAGVIQHRAGTEVLLLCYDEWQSQRLVFIGDTTALHEDQWTKVREWKRRGMLTLRKRPGSMLRVQVVHDMTDGRCTSAETARALPDVGSHSRFGIRI